MRRPAIHFLIIGAVLFFFFGRTPASKKEIVIQSSQIEQMKVDLKAQTGVNPDNRQVQAAIQEAIDDEVLYRQALKLKLDRTNAGVRHRLAQIAQFVGDGPALSEDAAYQKALDLGLDRTDPVVRRQLIANMKLIAARVPTKKEPATLTPEQIQSYYNENKSHFVTPERISFTHIFLSRDKWGKKGEAEARRILHELQEKQDVKGDLFLSGNHFSTSTPAMLSRFFDSQFVAQVFTLGPGKWQGPIASAYGWHVVWVEAVKAPQAQPLKEVVNQIVGDILQAREVVRLNDALHELRSQYTIRVESNAKT